MKKSLFFVVFLIILFVGGPFFFSNVYPNKYSIGNIKIHKPEGYFFHSFINSNEQHNMMCIYLLSCKNEFEYNGSMSTLTFHKLLDNYVTIVVKQFYDVNTTNEDSEEKEYLHCKIFRTKMNDEFFINGFSRDKNITFSIFANEYGNLENVLKDLCY
jgi:hypothetical protein